MLLAQALANPPRRPCALLSRGPSHPTAGSRPSTPSSIHVSLLKPLHQAVGGDQARPVCSLWPSWLPSLHLARGHHPVLTALTAPPLVCRPLVFSASRDWLRHGHFSSESALLPWGTHLGASISYTQPSVPPTSKLPHTCHWSVSAQTSDSFST